MPFIVLFLLPQCLARLYKSSYISDSWDHLSKSITWSIIFVICVEFAAILSFDYVKLHKAAQTLQYRKAVWIIEFFCKFDRWVFEGRSVHTTERPSKINIVEAHVEQFQSHMRFIPIVGIAILFICSTKRGFQAPTSLLSTAALLGPML